MLNRLEPIFEPTFDDANFGYRRGGSTKDAMRKISKEIEAGNEWIVDAVDKEGKTIDFMLSETRDRPAVLKFFKKAIGSSGFPQKVNIDKSGSNTAAMERINMLLFIYIFAPQRNLRSVRPN